MHDIPQTASLQSIVKELPILAFTSTLVVGITSKWLPLASHCLTYTHTYIYYIYIYNVFVIYRVRGIFYELPNAPILTLWAPQNLPLFLFPFKVNFLIWTWCTLNVIKISLLTGKSPNLYPKKVLYLKNDKNIYHQYTKEAK